MNPAVDLYFREIEKWREEQLALRRIILACGLTETLKWRQPCYTYQHSNVVLLGGFKNYCVISFFKGALLSDKKRLLQKPGENTQVARVIKFASVQEVLDLETTLAAYIQEAVAVEKSGVKADLVAETELVFVEELQHKLAEDAAFRVAFEALTPGRQRAYNLYFSAAKQSKTRTTLIEKYLPRIMDGKGINDCTCGHSKRMPTCDGSHKYI